MTSVPASVRLLDFLRTGQFGPIRVGGSKHDLLRHFGEADDYSRSRGRPGILKYGKIEFHLGGPDETIRLIFCDQCHDLNGGSGIALDPWILKTKPRMDELERQLQSADLTYDTVIDGSNPNVRLIRLTSGVTLMVAMENEPYSWPTWLGLFGFYLCLDRASATP